MGYIIIDNGVAVNDPTSIKLTEKGTANGVATLDGNVKIPTAQLPSLAITSVSVVATTGDRDNLVVESGDVCKVTGNGKTYIYDGATWLELTNANLTTDDVPEGLDFNRRYYTTQRVTDYLLGQMLNASVLFNNNGNIEGLNKGATGTYLRSNALSIAYAKINSDELDEGTTNLFYSDARVNTRLLSVLTTNEDILIRRGGVLNRLGVGANTQILSVVGGAITWSNSPTIITNLSGLNDVSINAVANNQFLRYDTGNNKWNNRTITTDDIPQTLNNRYCDSTAIQTRLLEILTGNEDILIRRAGNITRLPVAINHNDVLTYNGVSGNMQWQAPQVGVTTLHGLQDVLTDEPPQDKMFLMYNPNNGTGVDNFWVNSLAEIGDITGLQTALDGKIPLSTVTTAGDLILGTGNATVNRLAKGTDNQVLTVVGGNVQWNTPSSTTTDLTSLTDVTITTATTGQVLYKSAGDWVNQSLTTTNIPEGDNLYYTHTRVDTILQNKYNGKGVLQVGTDNLAYTQLAGPNDNTFVLYCNTATTTGLEWKQPSSTNIIEGTKLFYTDTRVDTRLNSKYTAKGRIQVGTGANTYQEQSEPASDFQVLTSDINNVLNNTGLSWATLALNGSYMSNVNITTPTNKQLLSYDTATAKWKNQTFDGTYALPLIAPNTAAYQGGTNIPFQTAAGLNTGMGTRAGGGVLSFFQGGVEYFTVSSAFVGLASNTPQFTIAGPGTATTPKLLFGTTGAGIYASGTNSEVWNWGRGGVQYGYISNVSLNTQTRLDIKNTLVDDYRMRINNVFNLFSFQNSAGTTTYFTVDSGNNRVRMHNRFVSDIQKLDNATNINTSITLNNNWFNVVFGDATSLTVTNNAGSTGNLSAVANTDEFQINNFANNKVKIDIQLSMLIDKDVDTIDFTLWNMNDNVEIVQFHRRTTVLANKYVNYSASGYYTPTLTNQRLSIKIKVNQNATVTAILTNMSILVQDLML